MKSVVLLFLIGVALVLFGVILWPLAQYFHFLAMSIVQIVLGLASMVLGVVLVLRK
jgi:ATP/ADP translocase